MSTKDGGPAFPQTDDATGSEGMTLRDYFAAKALAAYLSSDSWRLDMDHAATARCAYSMAEAMLKERST